MPVKIRCVWEHNGGDSLLYAVDLIGAYTRGGNTEDARGNQCISEVERGLYPGSL